MLVANKGTQKPRKPQKRVASINSFREFGELCVGLKTISIAIQEPFPTRNDLDGAMFVADGTFFVKRDNNSAFAWICIGQFAKSVHFACPCSFLLLP